MTRPCDGRGVIRLGRHVVKLVRQLRLRLSGGAIEHHDKLRAGHGGVRREAVLRGAVYKMPLSLYRTYTPGPDAPLALLWLACAVYPDTFGDIDLPKQAVKYYKEIFGIDVSAERAREIFGAPQGGGAGC